MDQQRKDTVMPAYLWSYLFASSIVEEWIVLDSIQRLIPALEIISEDANDDSSDD
ncbi:MAG: hypothetical protein KF798_03825 [Candidatus Paracaedibacteraceae bacterium]|nr:hypothetical protein [Candidatus Paracaedibacteraceae bacterium]